VVVDPSDNTLEYTDAAGTLGTAAAVDASMTFDYYVSDLDFAGNPVVDPFTGDDVETVNDGEASGTVVPLDPRDADAPFVLNTPAVDPANDDDARIEAKSIAIQKSVATVVDIGAVGTTPGDVVEYTISGQVSDYFTFGDIDVNDVLSDGQTFDASFTPTLAITEGGATTAVTLAGFFTVDESERTTCGDGTTAIDFEVSAADLDGTGDGILTGGLVPAASTGATTFEIIFRAGLDDAYTCSFSGTGPLSPNDFVDNDVTVTGEVLDNATQAPQAVPQFESDGSGTQLNVLPITVEKSVWARNGTVGGLSNPAEFAAGDTITYRLSLEVPSSDFEDLTLADFLPLPTLVATGLTQEGSACTASNAPAVDSWCFGPDDDFNALGGFVDPTTSFDTTANSITWDFGTQEFADNESRTIELLFTLEISGAAFRDGLFLTNQVQVGEQNSFGTPRGTPAIVQIQLTEPALNIDKGVVARSANPGSALSAPINPTGVVFDPVTTAAACPDYSGTVSSDNLSNGAPDGNATGLDARDIVRFAVVVENTGSGLNGAFDVTINDVVPAGFEVPAAGLDLCITNGAGAAIPNTTTGFFSGAPTVSPLGTGSITLADTATGSLAAANPTSGANVAVITYNLALVATTGANTQSTTLTNTANITNYSATEGGPSFLPVTPTADLADTASVATRPLSVSKTLTSTSQGSTSGAQVAIGEEAEYTVTVTVPEGTSRDVILVDTLQAGLVVSRPPTAAVLGADLTTDPATPLAPTISPNGRVLTFGLGDVSNSGVTGAENTVDAADQITFTYWAVVTNVAPNEDGQVRRNSAVISYRRGATGTERATQTARVPVTIVEPALQVAKSASVPTFDAGDVFTYTLLVDHSAAISNADAFEATLTDDIPAGLSYVGGTLAESGTPTTTLTESAGTIDATWTLFPEGSSTTITFDVIVDGAFNPTSPITNTADIAWTGLPGAPTTTLGGGEERDGTGGVDDYATTGRADIEPITP
ncbi:MAG: isopeptide-forming domain-containing fimbrial protein, partial [Ilumatobacter sp.]|uniref:isopeptide-forming domain-containing fimbrial protein n=1 Tax=Ilumatobacter sp. TaxID=1967498 RepID=UPI003C781E58